MTLLIRDVVAADAEALGRMHHASWVEAYSSLLPDEFWHTYLPETRIEQYRRSLLEPQPGTRLVVAEVDGAIVGHAMTGPGTDGAGGLYPAVREREVYSIYVLAAHHGSGLGQSLLDAVLAPDEAAQLWVFENNPRAIAFYRRNGFTPNGTRHVFGARFGNQPEIRMVR
ncbi:MAG TPA: GNAT family N-acetyltransferase [Humibacter sp.]|nr:GNAT family N-acetyltransferase [Humibacter sp.]